MSELSRVAEVELTFHPSRATHPKVESSTQCAEIIRREWDEGALEYRESVKVCILNNANRIMGIAHIGDGAINSCVADVRIIMQAAIVGNATAIILTHNHPSGSLRPSRMDDELTYRVKKACDLFEIRMLDHIIITADDYYSYSDNGKL